MLNAAEKLELTLMAVTARPLPLAGMRDALLERVELNLRQVWQPLGPLQLFTNRSSDHFSQVGFV